MSLDNGYKPFKEKTNPEVSLEVMEVRASKSKTSFSSDIYEQAVSYSTAPQPVPDLPNTSLDQILKSSEDKYFEAEERRSTSEGASSERKIYPNQNLLDRLSVNLQEKPIPNANKGIFSIVGDVKNLKCDATGLDLIDNICLGWNN